MTSCDAANCSKASFGSNSFFGGVRWSDVDKCQIRKVVHKDGCNVMSFFGEPSLDLTDQTGSGGLELVHRNTVAWLFDSFAANWGRRTGTSAPWSLVLFPLLAACTNGDVTPLELGRKETVLGHGLKQVERDVPHLFVKVQEFGLVLRKDGIFDSDWLASVD